MKRKIISIVIIGAFLITAILGASITGKKMDARNNTDDTCDTYPCTVIFSIKDRHTDEYVTDGGWVWYHRTGLGLSGVSIKSNGIAKSTGSYLPLIGEKWEITVRANGYKVLRDKVRIYPNCVHEDKPTYLTYHLEKAKSRTRKMTPTDPAQNGIQDGAVSIVKPDFGNLYIFDTFIIPFGSPHASYVLGRITITATIREDVLDKAHKFEFHLDDWDSEETVVYDGKVKGNQILEWIPNHLEKKHRYSFGIWVYDSSGQEIGSDACNFIKLI
jgi:hypothetical protein